MFSRIALFSTFLAALSVVRADIEPSEPSPGNVYNQGQTCHISWVPDTTGTWKTMYIELMTGSNKAMVHLTTVATVDGTDANNATFDYPCPGVTPNSAIYFYQFTSPDSPNALWTGRFAIADEEGNVTPPPNATQPEGDPIPWGTGALLDASSATPPPPRGGAGTTVGSSSSASLSASSASRSSTSASLPSSSGITRVSSSSGSASRTSSASVNATGAATTSSASTNGAPSGVSMDSRLMQAATALGAVAFAFAVAL